MPHFSTPPVSPIHHSIDPPAKPLQKSLSKIGPPPGLLLAAQSHLKLQQEKPISPPPEPELSTESPPPAAQQPRTSGTPAGLGTIYEKEEERSYVPYNFRIVGARPSCNPTSKQEEGNFGGWKQTAGKDPVDKRYHQLCDRIQTVMEKFRGPPPISIISSELQVRQPSVQPLRKNTMDTSYDPVDWKHHYENRRKRDFEAFRYQQPLLRWYPLDYEEWKDREEWMEGLMEKYGEGGEADFSDEEIYGL